METCELAYRMQTEVPGVLDIGTEPSHIRDLYGLDDNKLTYFHAGRYKQLSQFGGKVIQELIA